VTIAASFFDGRIGIARARGQPTRRFTSVVIDRIAVVARFSGGAIQNAISARLVRDARGIASVAAFHIAVIACFCRIFDAVAANGQSTLGLPPISPLRIGVIACFARRGIENTIATRFIGRA